MLIQRWWAQGLGSVLCRVRYGQYGPSQRMVSQTRQVWLSELIFITNSSQVKKCCPCKKIFRWLCNQQGPFMLKMLHWGKGWAAMTQSLFFWGPDETEQAQTRPRPIESLFHKVYRRYICNSHKVIVVGSSESLRRSLDCFVVRPKFGPWSNYRPEISAQNQPNVACGWAGGQSGRSCNTEKEGIIFVSVLFQLLYIKIRRNRTQTEPTKIHHRHGNALEMICKTSIIYN